jgi:hypothetical protein
LLAAYIWAYAVASSSPYQHADADEAVDYVGNTVNCQQKDIVVVVHFVVDVVHWIHCFLGADSSNFLGIHSAAHSADADGQNG